MRFVDAYEGWTSQRLTQAEAADILGVTDRTFRRYINRYEATGVEGLLDKRIEQASHRMAPVDEVLSLESLYRCEFMGWNVRHFHNWYKREGGSRSYTWVKNKLQAAQLVSKAKGKGKHRKRRDRSPIEGMMIHQDGSTHQWIDGEMWDLIVTMDDATSEHYSMFFVHEEGTASSFLGVEETIKAKGLFCSFYTDRGSHYWHTPVAGGKVDKNNPTQFGRAMNHLGINMIAAYSPEARGRSERAFRTHQGRLPKELKKAGIKTMREANNYLKNVYLPAFNLEFKVQAKEAGNAFVPYLDSNLSEVLCEHYERTVKKDNCVSFDAMTLQIPANEYRMNYVNVKVRVHRYINGEMSVFHGPRCLARYTCCGELIKATKATEEVAA
jgi:transposase